MLLIENMAKKLIREGIAQDLGTDIFKNYKPNSPDDIIVITEYSGLGTAIGCSDLAQRSLQILVRGIDDMYTEQKCWDVFKIFNTEDREVELDDRIIITYPRSTPFKMEVDDRFRHSWVFNLGIATEIKY